MASNRSKFWEFSGAFGSSRRVMTATFFGHFNFCRGLWEEPGADTFTLRATAAVLDFKGDLVGIVGIPRCFGFEQGVEGYQEFSLAGHKDFLGGFLCSVLLREPKGEGFDDEVVFHDGLGGQYKMLRT